MRNAGPCYGMEDDKGNGIGGPFLVRFMSCAICNHLCPEPLTFLCFGFLDTRLKPLSPDFHGSLFAQAYIEPPVRKLSLPPIGYNNDDIIPIGKVDEWRGILLSALASGGR